jgi:hypothetical protein
MLPWQAYSRDDECVRKSNGLIQRCFESTMLISQLGCGMPRVKKSRWQSIRKLDHRRRNQKSSGKPTKVLYRQLVVIGIAPQLKFTNG